MGITRIQFWKTNKKYSIFSLIRAKNRRRQKPMNLAHLCSTDSTQSLDMEESKCIKQSNRNFHVLLTEMRKRVASGGKF